MYECILLLFELRNEYIIRHYHLTLIVQLFTTVMDLTKGNEEENKNCKDKEKKKSKFPPICPTLIVPLSLQEIKEDWYGMSGQTTRSSNKRPKSFEENLKV